MTAAEHAGPALTVAVVGGSGGCGASVLSAALATRAALAGRTVVAADLDTAGGGLDVVLGLERERGPRWRDLQGLRGAVDARPLRDRLPTSQEGVAVLSRDRSWLPPDLQLEPVVLAALATVTDLLLLDAPHDRIPLPAPDAVLLLALGTLPGLAGAQVVADRLLGEGLRPWLVTRSVRGPLRQRVSQVLDLPLLADLPDDAAVSTDLARGLAPATSARSRLGRVCDRVLSDLLVDRLEVAS